VYANTTAGHMLFSSVGLSCRKANSSDQGSEQLMSGLGYNRYLVPPGGRKTHRTHARDAFKDCRHASAPFLKHLRELLPPLRKLRSHLSARMLGHRTLFSVEKYRRPTGRSVSVSGLSVSRNQHTTIWSDRWTDLQLSSSVKDGPSLQ